MSTIGEQFLNSLELRKNDISKEYLEQIHNNEQVRKTVHPPKKITREEFWNNPWNAYITRLLNQPRDRLRGTVPQVYMYEETMVTMKIMKGDEDDAKSDAESDAESGAESDAESGGESDAESGGDSGSSYSENDPYKHKGEEHAVDRIDDHVILIWDPDNKLEDTLKLKRSYKLHQFYLLEKLKKLNYANFAYAYYVFDRRNQVYHMGSPQDIKNKYYDIKYEQHRTSLLDKFKQDAVSAKLYDLTKFMTPDKPTEIIKKHKLKIHLKTPAGEVVNPFISRYETGGIIGGRFLPPHDRNFNDKLQNLADTLSGREFCKIKVIRSATSFFDAVLLSSHFFSRSPDKSEALFLENNLPQFAHSKRFLDISRDDLIKASPNERQYFNDPNRKVCSLNHITEKSCLWSFAKHHKFGTIVIFRDTTDGGYDVDIYCSRHQKRIERIESIYDESYFQMPIFLYIPSKSYNREHTPLNDMEIFLLIDLEGNDIIRKKARELQQLLVQQSPQKIAIPNIPGKNNTFNYLITDRDNFKCPAKGSGPQVNANEQFASLSDEEKKKRERELVEGLVIDLSEQEKNPSKQPAIGYMEARRICGDGTKKYYTWHGAQEQGNVGKGSRSWIEQAVYANYHSKHHTLSSRKAPGKRRDLKKDSTTRPPETEEDYHRLYNEDYANERATKFSRTGQYRKSSRKGSRKSYRKSSRQSSGKRSRKTSRQSRQLSIPSRQRPRQSRQRLRRSTKRR